MKIASLYNQREFVKFTDNAVVLSPALYQKILSCIEYADCVAGVARYSLAQFTGVAQTIELEFYLTKFFNGSEVSKQWLCKTPIVILPYDKADSYENLI